MTELLFSAIPIACLNSVLKNTFCPRFQPKLEYAPGPTPLALITNPPPTPTYKPFENGLLAPNNKPGVIPKFASNPRGEIHWTSYSMGLMGGIDKGLVPPCPTDGGPTWTITSLAEAAVAEQISMQIAEKVETCATIFFEQKLMKTPLDSSFKMRLQLQ